MKRFWFLLIIFSFLYNKSSYALNNSRAVMLNSGLIYLSGRDLSKVSLKNASGAVKTCNISNFDIKDVKNGGGIINITSDKKAVIFYSSNRYLLVDEIEKCSNEIILHDSPDPNIDMLQGFNLKRKIYLSLVPEDKNSWSAIIANFGSDKNIITDSVFLIY